jgi:kynureninase
LKEKERLTNLSDAVEKTWESEVVRSRQFPSFRLKTLPSKLNSKFAGLMAAKTKTMVIDSDPKN